MATSGQARTTTAFGWVQLRWSEASQDITNNKTTINWYLEIYSQYSISSSAAKDYSVTINGSKVSSGTNTIGGSGTRTLKSGSTTITHNADGTKTFSYSFSQECAITWGSTYIGTVTGSETDTLDTIPRASQPSLNDTSVDYGTSVIIYTNRASTAFTHTLEYSWNGHTGTIATGVATSYTWTVPTSFMTYIPNATSSWGTITCKTYNGGTLIGTKTVTLTTTVPASVVPSFTTVTYSDTVTAATTLGAGIIQAVSKLSLAITGAAGSNGSTISSYKITFDGATYNASTATTGAIKGSGSLSLVGTITDSRGRTATKTITVTVVAYTAPKITAFSIVRCNSDGTANEMGTSVKVTRAGTFTSLSLKNTLSVIIKTRPRGTMTWTTANTSAALTGGTVASADVIVSTYAATSSFDFEIDFVDNFNTTISLAVLPTGLVTMSWGPSGIGVGKVWQAGALDVYGDVNIQGNINLTGIVSIVSGSIDMNNSNITNINHLTIKDIGGNEGLEWLSPSGLNNWKVVVTTDDATGNDDASVYPLQFFRNGVRIATFGTTGRFYLTGASANNGMYLDGSGGDGLLYGYGNVKLQAAGGTASLESTTSWAKIMSAGTGADSYIQQNGVAKVVAPNTTTTYKPIYASAFTVSSERKIKTNIAAAKAGALDKIRSASVYEYHLENELGEYELIDGSYTKVADLDPAKVKKRKGLILDEAPEEIVFGDGIDLYAMTSMLWKAVQELSEQVNFLSNKLSKKVG